MHFEELAGTGIPIEFVADALKPSNSQALPKARIPEQQQKHVGKGGAVARVA